MQKICIPNRWVALVPRNLGACEWVDPGGALTGHRERWVYIPAIGLFMLVVSSHSRLGFRVQV